jgi:hypothetical protein
MSKPTKIKDAVRLSVVLSKAQAAQVQQTARRMSVQENRTISASEAIRMAIETVYPLNEKQLDLF